MRTTTVLLVAMALCLTACRMGGSSDAPSFGTAGAAPGNLVSVPTGPGVPVKVTMPSKADEGSEVVLAIELDYSQAPTFGPISVVLVYELPGDWLNAPTRVYMNAPPDANHRVTTTLRVRTSNREGVESRTVTVRAIAYGPTTTYDEASAFLSGQP